MRLLLLSIFCALPLLAQSNMGELRLKVLDPSGHGAKASVELVSEANRYRQSFQTDDSGNLTVKRLPFGVYQLQLRRPGFTPATETIEIRSAVPQNMQLQLKLSPVNTTIEVQENATLIDPYRVGSADQIGQQTIANRATSLPGRSLQDLVNSQPGWLYEGNAVLHPRGSEYQTQFVVDGIPLTDNRSPGHGTEIEADDVESMSVYTAGIPAEYGRKMGGVIDVNTLRNIQPGVHGQLNLSGGSFATAGAFGSLQYMSGRNTFELSADGAITGRYLSPPVPQNFTNTATTGDFSGSYERDLTSRDRLTVTYRHELARFQIPNEQVQQSTGQRQNGDLFEDMGTASYQHVFSSDVVANVHSMLRGDSDDLASNPLSTPIIAFQHNAFTEAYFNASTSIHHHNQEWKVGVESDNTFLNEHFADIITDPSHFDPGTPKTFSFSGNRPDLEQSAFMQDLVRLGEWTLSAGLRWDHYQLLVNQNAVSPRIGVSRYFTRPDLRLHASYDRVFQTPAFENILLSSSAAVVALNPNVLRLPVQPSHGNYYEAGLTTGLFRQLSLDVNGYYRTVNNFADDNLLLNTPVSFPVAFRKANIYGSEAKLNLPHWRKWSGFVSYSYMVGSAHFPVTGGLFVGEDATNALTQLSGRFWVSQDQRNTVRTRFRYQIATRLWFTAGASYGSGLPVDFSGTYEQALAEYGPEVVARVNFARSRVRPNFSIDASAGADLVSRDTFKMTLQADGFNLNDRLNLIDFAGLFSGNAIAPPRSFGLRLRMQF